MASGGSKTTFALVHGAWHGAWCFERLSPALEARGHRVVAMDLPSDDPAATFETYADAVLEALGREVDDVVLVGHSLAGHTIPIVASRLPVRRLVYLCALVPAPGRSFIEQRESDPDMLFPDYLNGMSDPDAEGRLRWTDETLARQIMYADCDEQDALAAVQRLRPQALAPYREPCPLDSFPSTPCTYVVCTEDRLVNPEWSRRVAQEVLEADLVELPRSHSPFLSRPDELANVLQDCVTR